MKSKTLKRVIAMTLLAALAIPVGLAAQIQQSNKQQTRYKLVDLGTLGGPTSGVPTVFYETAGTLTAGAQGLSNRETATGTSDTSISDPLCFFDPCLYENAFLWENGMLTSLGALPGGQWSAANWISGSGLVAGFSENGQTDPLDSLPEFHGTLWQNGRITDLGTLAGGNESWGWAVNNPGRVVGFATNGSPDPYSYFYFQILGLSSGTQTRAFSWDQRNGMHDLGTLGGPDAWAGLENDQGQIVGISYISSTANADNGGCPPNVPTQDPFFWDAGRGIADMGTFGGTCGVPNALNNRGQVVGESYLSGNLAFHAFLWDKKSNPPLLDLGTLGGDNAAALWVNDAGDVVGFADLPNAPGCSGSTCVHHAFLWAHGVMTDLGSVDGDLCSRAVSINANRQIVGFTAAVCGGNPSRAFLWQDGGPAVDLNTLIQAGSGLTLTEAIYINDQGEITGNGVLANGDTHAFVLIPCEGDEGCDHSPADASPQTNSARVTQRPYVPPDPPMMGRGMLPRFGGWRFPGPLRLGPAAGPAN